MDVQLICGAGNTCVKAHRLVLAALSPVFRQIFIEIGPFSEEDYVIVLAEVEANVIQSFLQRYLSVTTVLLLYSVTTTNYLVMNP